MFEQSERASFAPRFVASVKVNDAVTPRHSYKLATEQKAAERLQTDTNNGKVCLYLCWQKLPTQINLGHKAGGPSL